VAERGGLRIHRPWLDVPAQQLRDWLVQEGVTWVEDPTNQDERYTRNRIRHQLLPVLEQAFPSFRQTFGRSARHAAQAQMVLDDMALIDLQFLGIDNVLALRGDSIKTESSFRPHTDGHAYAEQLIHQISDMNRGNYMMDDVQLEPTDFCIGAAGYPEKHFEAMNLAFDLQNLKRKVDAGAEYVVTQMFFDNKKFFSFVEECRKIGIQVPIIPGLKPIKNLTHISFLPKFFHIDYPIELSTELLKCKDNKSVEQVGIEWGIQQSKELKAHGVPCIHYYTMSNSTSVQKIAREVF
jgi:methylenetetrahydrofolate reductase (NADPH)